ncbi:hypothetical protein N7462_008537 [Penicillium macrosclerotiorum]|uniref:uncharacterized protein n=1 Tax=Penicillium macrosclerotiorum TaxID=303699 RepID=UPI00254858DB|nr:uncharacterized protein N7462_008537 [Penicillium macrosclerotiorum]KAJ5675640.1 hypothetical protein N7462_008537 [Penicillium macrosclerotiorum]
MVFAIFGGMMGLVEALNGLGVAFTSNPTGNKRNAGKILVLASLGVQLCVICSFFLMATIFYVRCVKHYIRNKAIPALPFILYVSMFLILIRSIYRVIEHAGDTSVDLKDPNKLQSMSSVMRYEWYFYVFEATTILLNSLLWNVFDAGRFLPQNAKIFLAEDGVTEMIIPETPEDQPRVAQIGRLIMQLITFGLWGQVFPQKTTHKESNFEYHSEPELTEHHYCKV